MLEILGPIVNLMTRMLPAMQQCMHATLLSGNLRFEVEIFLRRKSFDKLTSKFRRRFEVKNRLCPLGLGQIGYDS